MAYADKKDQQACSRRYYLEHKDELIIRKKSRMQNIKLNDPERYKEIRARENEQQKVRMRERSLEQINKDNHARRLRKFKLTEEDFESLLIDGKRICWVCGVEEGVQVRRLNIDHCHIVERIHGIRESVRGLLCHRCNSMAGYLDDSPELIRAWAETMAEYLSNYRRKFYE